MKEYKTIGIVGGMGPEAGIDLFRRILANSSGRTDQDHLPVMLMSLPGQLADRTAFLEGLHRSNPAYKIAEIIGKLERAGAGIAGIACNTCHASPIFSVIEAELEKARSRIKLLNMVAESHLHIKDRYPHLKRIGVMTTNGGYRSRVYSGPFSEWGYDIVIPDPVFQNESIHRMIYDPGFGIKANPGRITSQTRSLMDAALRYFRRKGAEAVILGCTELSLVTSEDRFDDLLLIDPTETLAMALIREARSVVRESSPI